MHREGAFLARACLTARGFSLTSRTFCSMRSMGRSTRRLASRLNTKTPAATIRMMNSMRSMFSSAFTWDSQRVSSTAALW